MSADQLFLETRKKYQHPDPAPFPARFAPAVLVKDMLYLSGEGPRWGREVKYQGTIWETLSIDDAKSAAEITTLNLLYHTQKKLGSLCNVVQVAELLGFVRSTPNFREHPAVLDSASDLILSIFGDRVGEHARCAIGVSSLPIDICIEMRMVMHVDVN